ncbi:MAG: CCA tRNA nucleotidyltransferase [Elusimicrobia bacterium]|nr:CCA tRNA nucleotidyltransferase [Elusimicrobiota bacterium]
MFKIKKLKFLKANRNIWIVGGYIRDSLLGKITKDIDFATDGNTKKIAQKFADKTNGSFVVLDDFNKIYRVVINDEIYDFSKMQGKNILEDLSRRDFTINAMAIKPVGSGKWEVGSDNPIDPFNGLSDIKRKIVRAVSERNFIDDPLRLLRAYRFAGQLNFSIEPKTEKFIKKYSHKLKNVSNERIQNELFLMLELPNSYNVIMKIYKAGLLKEIMPELVETLNTARCYYPKMGLLGHSFDALKILEEFYNTNFKNVFPKFSKRISSHLEEKISKTTKRKTLLKLAALLHDIGKPKSAKKIKGRLRFFEHEERGCDIINILGKRLTLSNNEIKYLKNLTKHHMRIGNLTSAEKLTDRAAWRFFRDLSDDAIDLIVLSVTDAYTYPKGKTRTLHKIMANKLLNKFYRQKEKIVPKKLLNGFEIMKILKIPESPLVGKILGELEEAQVLKKIKTKNEAEKFLKTIYKNKKI